MAAEATTVIERINDTEIERFIATLGPEEKERAGFGCLQTEKGALPLEAMDVRGSVTGLFADTVVKQTYVNVHDTPLEATYIFPLPDRAAVTRFVMRAAGRSVEGIIKERGAARREYDQAIAVGHRAAIAEEDRPGVFTMRVGNIPAGEKVEITLEMTGPLPFADGEATYRFPLVVAPRYIPGSALEGPSVGDGVAADTDQVPDASRISPPVLLPGMPNPIRLSLKARVDGAGLALKSIRSSLHAVKSRKGKTHTVALRPEERLNRDFILRIGYASESVVTGLVTAKGEGDEEGSFCLTVVPPETARFKPRDVVFVLDRSGSMSGWKMVCARRATARMIDSLAPDDRFAFLAFDTSIEWPAGMEGRLVPATDRNRFRAVQHVSTVTDRGGTEMFAPLKEATRLLAKRDKKRERVIVLITDGQVGNEDMLVQLVRKEARGTRVFTVGIDQAVNAAFLKRLALPSRGLCELVESEDRLDEVMAVMHRRIGRPALTDLAILDEGLGIVKGSLVPDRMPDLYEGVPAVIMGRFTGDAEGRVVLKGKLADGESLKQKIEALAEGDDAIRKAWARGRIRDLEDRYVASQERDGALADKITRFSLDHSILCRFTAFVAVDRKEKIEGKGKLHRVNQPVEAPAGWDALAGAPCEAEGDLEEMSCDLCDDLGSGGLAFSGSMPSAPPQPPAAAPSPCPAPCAPSPGPAPGAPAKPRAKMQRLMSRCTSASTPPAPTARGKDRGVFAKLKRGVKSLLGGDEEVSERLCSFESMARQDYVSCEPEAPAPVDPYAPYRSDLGNVAVALDTIASCTDVDDARDEVGYLVGDLRLLIEQYQDRNAPDGLVEALEKILALLAPFEAPEVLMAAVESLDDDELAEALIEARKVLDGLALGGSKAPQPHRKKPVKGREDFWK